MATEDELKALREAMLGNPRQYSTQGRNNFGCLGDMGGLPAALADLYTKGSQPTYGLDATTGQGRGWAGPYITPILREDLADLLKDPYGNNYNYTTTAYTRGDGEVVSARIRSFGPNKTDDLGAGDDKQIEILRRETRSTISGYVTDSAETPISGATVTLYRPVNGSVIGINPDTISGNRYTFTAGVPNGTDVPYGVRTVTATSPAAGDPRVATGSALAIDDNNLSFNITNWGQAAVTVTSIQLTYTFTPTGYYKEVWVGGNHIFKFDDPIISGINYNGGNRRGTGDTLTIIPSSITVNGGTYTSTTRILVDSDNVLLPNIILYPRGGTLNVRYLEFMRNQSGGGPTTDVVGQTFTVTLNGAISLTPFVAHEED